MREIKHTHTFYQMYHHTGKERTLHISFVFSFWKFGESQKAEHLKDEIPLAPFFLICHLHICSKEYTSNFSPTCPLETLGVFTRFEGDFGIAKDLNTLKKKIQVWVTIIEF